MKKIRLAYLVSHPIQYQAPLLRRINQEPDIDLTTLFCSDLSAKEYRDTEFGASFKWDVPLLEGYKYKFLPAFVSTQQLSFLKPFNYGITRALKKGRFDALWVHGWGYWSHIWAILIAKMLRIKVLIRGESNLHTQQYGTLKRTAKEMFIRRIIALSDAFLSIGSLNREFYIHYGAKHDAVCMVPYVVNNDFFQEKCRAASAERESLRCSLGLKQGRPVILYASKMTERKRARDLLEAYARLSPDGHTEPEPYLLFIGDGEMRSALERRSAELGWGSIRFLGFKNQTELPAFYDLCDVFVLPSFHEPWGLVINEVMNAAKPVIVSDHVGCAPDLVNHKGNGYIFRAGDIDDLYRALRFVLDDKERCRVMGQKSLEVINRWGFEEDITGLRKALKMLFGNCQ